MKKILIEASVLEQDKPTGVNYFTEGLARGLEQVRKNRATVGYFWLNFLGKKSPKHALTKKASKNHLYTIIKTIPQRVYAKLSYYAIAPPLVLPKADWVIFPNFYVWPSLRRTKKAVVIHDLSFIRCPEYVEAKNHRFLSKMALRSARKADLIISISQFTTRELTELTGTPQDKIITLNIPINQADFDKKDDKGRDYLAKRYGIKKRYIMTLGTLEPRKNLELAVNAYCLLPKSIRDQYSLLLIGKWGWKYEKLQALIEEKRSKGFDIITPGHADRDDRATLYFNASFYVFTTYYEGFGMPLLEALYCGIPTVAVDIPVLREVGGTDACLWSSYDAAEFSAKLQQLIEDTALAASLSKKAKRQAKVISWDETANKLLARLLAD